MAIQRNVQQQNTLSKEDMLRWAALLEEEDKLPWLHVLLQQNGLESRQGALVSLKEVPEQLGSFYSGVWIGPDQRFWEFAATVGTKSVSVELEKFVEITNEITVTKNVAELAAPSPSWPWRRSKNMAAVAHLQTMLGGRAVRPNPSFNPRPATAAGLGRAAPWSMLLRTAKPACLRGRG